SRTGLFYFFDQFGKLIYLGKATNIRKRVNQIFASDNEKSRKLQADTFDVTFELTGSELIASLKEVRELRNMKPKYNRTGQKSSYKWSMVKQTDAHGYDELYIVKRSAKLPEILAFTNLSAAKSTLFALADSFGLCRLKCRLEDPKVPCSAYPDSCNGACTGELSAGDYNQRVWALVRENSFVERNAVIVDRGRSVS